MHMHSKMMTVFVECVRLDLENHSKCPMIQKPHNFESPTAHQKIISTQISEQKILMWFLSHNIPKRNKLAEKNLIEKPRIYAKLLIAM